MESKKEIHVREAVKEDCHQIIKLIKMFARDENMEHTVKIDTETLIRDGFTENKPPSFKCLVSHDANNQLSGYLIYYYTYSTWEGRCIFFPNIFLDAQFRRMGIGKKFITKLAQIAYAEDMARIELFIFDWNQLSIDFHQSLGAVKLTNKLAGNNFRFSKNSIQQLAKQTKESKHETHQVREAVKDDCHQIIKLIKMLARYVKMEDAVKIDDETLIRDGFRENEPPSFKCLVSHDANNRLSGYLIYYYTYSPAEGRCIYMEDIFVDPQFRKMGIGTKMITKLAQIAYAEDMARIDLSILDWNQLSIDFHQSLGAVNLTNKLAWNKFRYGLFGWTINLVRKTYQQIDSTTLIDDGFTENKSPSFKYLVSHGENQQLSGYLIYYYTYPWEGRSISILNIFVDPQFRKMGIGKRLLTELAQIAYAENIARIDFLILDWNKLFMDFHQSLGAFNLSEKQKRAAFRFDKNSIQQLATNCKNILKD